MELQSTYGKNHGFHGFKGSEDIIRFIVPPPPPPQPPLYLLMTNGEIWRLRNHIIFQEGNIDILKYIENVKSRFAEYSNLLSMENVLTPEPSLPVWSPTPLSWIKVNVDAALSSSKSALAAVAQDSLSLLPDPSRICLSPMGS